MRDGTAWSDGLFDGFFSNFYTYICVHKFSVAADFNAYALSVKKYVHKRKALRIAADDVPVNCVKKKTCAKHFMIIWLHAHELFKMYKYEYTYLYEDI